MHRPFISLVLVILFLSGFPQAVLAQSAIAPDPPATGPFSVQMFVGGTQLTYLSVFPPSTYVNGAAIAPDTPVQIRVYRWDRAGRVWSPVTLEGGDGPWGSGGLGRVGQSFINMVAVTPVDCIPPRVIVLGVTSVVNGVESPVVNTANLTYQYAAPPTAGDPTPYDADPCIPLLVRYATPGAALSPDQAPPVISSPPGAAAPPPAPTAAPAPPPVPPTPPPPPPSAPGGPPQIDEVRPVLGALRSAEVRVPGALRNMHVVIIGRNFDSLIPSNNRVTFNGVDGEILGVTSVEIRAEVPVGASSGPVQVLVSGVASNPVDFAVTANYANAVVAEDVRFGREYLPDLLQAALGAPDHDGPAGTGTPGTNIGIGIGGSITLDLGEGQLVYDGPGNDFVVYERGGGPDESLANEGYEVQVSNDPLAGFVSLGIAFGVDRGVGDGFDLALGRMSSARYIRIVDDADDTTVNGADIDAVEIVSLTPPPAEPAAAGALDLVFVIDLTASMADDIANVKRTAVEILDTLAAEFSDHRVAILGYRDWGDATMFEDYPFSSDRTTIVDNINRLSVTGGGDWPEAVLEALLRAIESTSLGSWRNDVTKQIILMGDAPPHDPIPQGPHAGKSTSDVDLAAKRADPVVINTIVVRPSAETEAAFSVLAAGSGGASTRAERAEDVPGAILGTIGEIAGKPPSPPVVTVTEEAEPNNKFGTPNPIALTGAVTGRIDPQRDVDWYEVAVDRGGELHVTITEVDPALDVVFRTWNADKGILLDWQQPLDKGGDVDALVDLPSAGRYYLEVREGRDDAASSVPYRLTTVFTPMVDAAEPNDSFGTASDLRIGVPTQANILPRRDHDWYKFDVPGRAELHVLITDVSADLDIVFRVWNNERDIILDWQSPLRPGADTEALVDFASAGQYFLEVADARDDQRSSQPYTLKTTMVPVVDTDERNDTFGAAQVIRLGEPVQGTILPRRDHDWYRFDIPGRAELHVLVTEVAPELEIAVRAWNGNKDIIQDWQVPLRSGGDTETIIDFDRPGVYYLQVSDSRDDQRSTKPYVLLTRLTPVVDLNEGNDRFGSATRIQLGETVRGSILPRGDHDWYQIALLHQGQLAVAITDSPANLEMVFRVWDADKAIILDWQAPMRAGGDVTGSANIPGAGVYYIEVADSRDDGRSTESYNLTASLTGS